MKGKFIVIEGADGSGKGTQHKLLKERLEREGISFATVDFPQYDTGFFGGMVGKMLMGKYGDFEKIDPHLAAVVYAADRWEASKHVREALDAGKVVLGNRYTLSSKAHQSARLPNEEREEFNKFLDEMEFSTLGIPQPDLYLYMDVPLAISTELVLQKSARAYTGNESRDALERNVQHQIEAQRMYAYLAETDPRITTIECTKGGVLLPPDEIHELVFAEVSHFLDNGYEGRIKGERQL